MARKRTVKKNTNGSEVTEGLGEQPTERPSEMWDDSPSTPTEEQELDDHENDKQLEKWFSSLPFTTKMKIHDRVIELSSELKHPCPTCRREMSCDKVTYSCSCGGKFSVPASAELQGRLPLGEPVSKEKESAEKQASGPQPN